MNQDLDFFNHHWL